MMNAPILFIHLPFPHHRGSLEPTPLNGMSYETCSCWAPPRRYPGPGPRYSISRYRASIGRSAAPLAISCLDIRYNCLQTWLVFAMGRDLAVERGRSAPPDQRSWAAVGMGQAFSVRGSGRLRSVRARPYSTRANPISDRALGRTPLNEHCPSIESSREGRGLLIHTW